MWGKGGICSKGRWVLNKHPGRRKEMPGKKKERRATARDTVAGEESGADALGQGFSKEDEQQ